LEVQTVADPGHASEDDRDVITGPLLDATSLRKAGIEQAEGIVITVADDTLALAVTMLAREMRPGIFTVLRQSEQRNTPLFDALGPDLATLSGYVVAAEVLRIVRAPLLSYFLSLARHQDEPWAAALLSRLRERIGDEVPDSWALGIEKHEAPAVIRLLGRGLPVRVGDLMRSPAGLDHALEAVPLLLQRRRGKVLLPTDEENLEAGDQLLICGRPEARSELRWTLQDPVALASLCRRAAGEPVSAAGGTAHD
ncbi:MAG: NAD-binding protein, partial [Gammaproteobacteria bacterium]